MFVLCATFASAIVHATLNGIGLALGFTVLYSIKEYYHVVQDRYASGYSWKEALIPPLISNWLEARRLRNQPEEDEQHDLNKEMETELSILKQIRDAIPTNLARATV